MCIARVGKAVAVRDGMARVEFFDGRALDGVDVSVINASAGDFVEVFGNLALSVLSSAEAKSRMRAWAVVTKALARESSGAARR